MSKGIADMIELFNFWHNVIFWPILGGLFVLGMILVAFRKHKKFTKIVILLMLLTGVVLHFLRLAFPSQGDTFMNALSNTTPATLCAISTMIFPLIFLFGGQFWKDYMFYVGIASGLLALVLPMAQYGTPALEFDTFRYVICHSILVVCPMMMVLCGHHRLSWKTFWTPIIGLLIVSCVIIANDLILVAVGVLDLSMADFLSQDVRNTVLLWGPAPLGDTVVGIFNAITPEFLRTNPFDGSVVYWPIVWLLPAVLIAGLPLFFIMYLLFAGKHFFHDVKYFFYMMTGNYEKVEKVESGKKLSKLRGKAK